MTRSSPRPSESCSVFDSRPADDESAVLLRTHISYRRVTPARSATLDIRKSANRLTGRRIEVPCAPNYLSVAATRRRKYSANFGAVYSY